MKPMTTVGRKKSLLTGEHETLHTTKMQSVVKIRILHWCELFIFPEISLVVVIWTEIIMSVLNTWARLGLRRKSNLSYLIESSVVWSLLCSVTLCRSKCEWARYYTTKKCPQRVCV